ncbi:MAG TPA: PQQ-binding-like beta-propeller repeat protein [Bacteroidota bacterium]|nr:PQQ-binding-like beta-propeller repeat protein [Bacteroidota bacterium]
MKPISCILLACFFSSCAGLKINRSLKATPEDWVTLGGAPTRVNQSSSTLRPPFSEAWEYNTVAGMTATPLVRDSVIVLGTLNGEVQVVNFRNGKRLGYVSLDAPIAGTPVWDGSNVIVPLSGPNASLISMSLRSPDRLWALTLGPIESSPLLQGDYVYVTTLEGNAYCLKKNDGSEVWKFKTTAGDIRKPIRSSPASDGETIFFGCDDAAIYAVNQKEGTLKWRFQTKGSVFATPVVLAKQIVVGSLDGHVYCLDSRNGNLMWRFDTRSRIYGAASTDGYRVFVGAADGVFYALEAETGTPAWSVITKSVINAAALVVGGIVYVGSLDRTLYAYDAGTGKDVWQFSAPGRIRVSPVSWGNTLLLVSEDRLLIALRPLGDL